MLPSPWLILGCVLALAGAVTGAYVKGRGDGKAIEQAQSLTAAAIREETLRIATEASATAIAQMKVKHVTIRQETEREIVERPIPADCTASDRLLELTNAAITGSYTPSASQLPAPGRDDGKAHE